MTTMMMMTMIRLVVVLAEEPRPGPLVVNLI